jgi:hypothetical protein
MAAQYRGTLGNRRRDDFLTRAAIKWREWAGVKPAGKVSFLNLGSDELLLHPKRAVRLWEWEQIVMPLAAIAFRRVTGSQSGGKPPLAIAPAFNADPLQAVILRPKSHGRYTEDHDMDVAAWLRGLGLGQYAPAFQDNAIDGEVLRELTSDDLKDLGVILVGHRRRLLAAIAILGAEPANPDMLNRGRVRSVLSSIPRDDAERRQLTVMFCDLVVRRRFRHGLIPRICARSSAHITRPLPKPSPSSMALSRNTWVTVSWSISATRERMRTMPSGLSERDWPP